MSVIIDPTGEEVEILFLDLRGKVATCLLKDGSEQVISTMFLVSDGGVPELIERANKNRGILR